MFTPLTFHQPLVLQLIREDGGPPLARHRLRAADFSDVAAEAWRDACLRAGHATTPLSAAPMQLSPIFTAATGPRGLGFEVEVTRPDGTTAPRGFTLQSLRHVADHLTGPLLQAEVLKPGDAYRFEVVAEDAVTPASAAADSPPAPVPPAPRIRPLAFLSLPLRPLLHQASPVALLEDEDPPVFFTRDALRRAEAGARRGELASIETGAALIGSLAACPESGEFFSIVHDVLEIEAATEEPFSLAYSGQSWQRLHRILAARQAAHPERVERLLGQAHGHPFRPNDGKVCADCARRAACTLSSAWASDFDQRWHRAVFARQPWALCHIFGLTARGDAVHQLFGLRDGRLQARGFHLLPEFNFP